MIEKIYNKKKLYALIVRAKFRKKKGISFFTPNETNQQFGYMKHNKGHLTNFTRFFIRKFYYVSSTRLS